MNHETKKRNRPKARYFAFLLYPDSLHEGWVSDLEKTDIAMAISPLHDMDVREVDKEHLTEKQKTALKAGKKLYKKPHYHVLYVAKNPVTTEAVRAKIKRSLGNDSCSYVEIVDGVGSYYEYLTHESKDAIEKKKHVYDAKDIKCLNGFDIDRYVVMDSFEKNELIDMLCMFIYKEKLENVFELLDFIHENSEKYDFPNMRKLNRIIRTNSGALRMYFDGAFQSRKKSEEKEMIDKKGN